MSVLSPADILALSSAVNDAAVKAARKGVAPGVYPVDVSVRITGSLSVGAPCEAVATCRVSMYGVLARALESAGCTRDSIARIVTDAVAAELRGEATPLAEQLEAQVEELRQRFAAELPKVARSGAVSGRGLTVSSLVAVDIAEMVAK